MAKADLKKQEFQKTFVERDSDHRIVCVYTADSSAKDGDKCAVTAYAYEGSDRDWHKSLQGQSVWKAEWDI